MTGVQTCALPISRQFKHLAPYCGLTENVYVLSLSEFELPSDAVVRSRTDEPDLNFQEPDRSPVRGSPMGKNRTRGPVPGSGDPERVYIGPDLLEPESTISVFNLVFNCQRV